MKDIKMRSGEYTNNAGEVKTNWVTVGVFIEKGDKQYVKINATLTTPEVFCSVFERREGVGQEKPAAQEAVINVDETTEIPF